MNAVVFKFWLIYVVVQREITFAMNCRYVWVKNLFCSKAVAVDSVISLTGLQVCGTKNVIKKIFLRSKEFYVLSNSILRVYLMYFVLALAVLIKYQRQIELHDESIIMTRIFILNKNIAMSKRRHLLRK